MLFRHSPLHSNCRLSLVIAAILFSASSVADESFDEMMGGFEEDAPIIVQTKKEMPPSPYQLSGTYGFLSSFNYAHNAPTEDNTDFRGLSRAKNQLSLQLDVRLSNQWKARIESFAFYDLAYQINGRDDYSNSVIETYESEVEIVEAWVQGSLSKQLDIKVGRQISVWGKSDNIRITDVINPLNNREPGMTDIEALRLPVLTSRIDYYPNHTWHLSALIIHESRTPKEAATGSDYLPLEVFPFPPGFVFPDDETPEQNFDNTQFGLALNGVFQGWDLSVYAATVFDSRWHFEENNAIRRYGRISMLGAAANITQGSWLLKTELAAIKGLKYNTTLDEKNRLDILLGAEYRGIKDASISIELANRHIGNYESQMINAADFTRENEVQTALRATHSFNNDTIDVTWLISLFGKTGNDGGFQRLWMNYDIKDGLIATLGAVDYIGGESNNDRIFSEIKYSF